MEVHCGRSSPNFQKFHMLPRILTVTIAIGCVLSGRPIPQQDLPTQDLPTREAPTETRSVTPPGVTIAPQPAPTQPPGSQATASQPLKDFMVENGTRIPLSIINSISTRYANPGDRVYLETAFPIVVTGKIVIPAGSYVMGTI